MVKEHPIEESNSLFKPEEFFLKRYSSIEVALFLVEALWSKLVCKDTLVFRNWPPELTDLEIQDFLVNFGAKTVKVIKNKAFAKFDSEVVAKNILIRLHQIEVLGSYLSVEYAKEEIGCDKVHKNFSDLFSDCDKNFTVFLNKLNSWNSSVNFNQPPPPNLKYLYPKANRATINNIAHALATVPKFYTQVLHLMNRLNLPPPFSNIPDSPEIQNNPILSQRNLQKQDGAKAQDEHGTHVRDGARNQDGHPTNEDFNKLSSVEPQKSTSESEYETDPDDFDPKIIKEIIPQKRKKISQKKVVKRPKFVKPTENLSTVAKVVQNPEEVFEVVDFQRNQKKIEVKAVENLDYPKEDSINIVEESFGKIPSHKVCETSEEQSELTSEERIEIISDQELFSNQIDPKDFGLLPVFKNYHPGPANCRLYIKNLAKNVTLSDLEKIYKRYDSQEKENNMFDIRLMQEGRMKGQAFVTLQNVSLAEKAVKETNGYILKNKPLVVVFARSATPKTK